MLYGSRGREDDENPLPPGPWDPIIRSALEQIHAFGPRPEPWRAFADQAVRSQPALGNPVPWRLALASLLAKHPEIFDLLGGGHGIGEEVMLNPQPLPPRFAFLVSVAQAVISRAELLQELADATAREGDEQGIIIVSGYTSRFSEDWCGNEFRPKWPFPGPPPPWFASELDGIDLVVMATQFDQAAKGTFSPVMRRSLTDASMRFVEAGLSKMQ